MTRRILARRSNSRSVVKAKQRSFVPTRRARTAAPKKLQRSIFSQRKKPHVHARIKAKPQRTVEVGNWWQTILLWLFLAIAAVWIIWYILLWGIGPKLVATSEDTVVAVLSSSPAGDAVIAQLNPDLKESKVYILDGEESIALPGSTDRVKLNELLPTVQKQLTNPDKDLSITVFNRVFGVFIDTVSIVAQPLSNNQKELSQQLKSTFWSEVSSGKKIDIDLLRVWYAIQYSNTLVTDDNTTSLADDIRMQTGGTFAAHDECRIAILNSTATSGLAGGLADIVEKNGGIVIRLGQYPEPLAKSKLLYDPSVKECKEAIEQVKSLSPVPFEVVSDPSVQGQFRAPVVAIIGENFQ